MLPPLPPWLAPRYALTGLKLSLTALVVLFAVVGCTTQTVRLEGAQIRLPLIGTVGPQGWKPYALGLERKVVKLEGKIKVIRVDLELSEARHVATKRAYEEAQAEAARMEAERLARVIARQEEITDEVRQNYSRRIADLRKRAARLQAEARAGAGGSSDQVRVSETGNAASGADEAPRCDQFPTPDITTELNCREIAEQQAIQLDSLITWVQRQFGVQ